MESPLKQEKSLVSLIIPVYNCGAYLVQCLDSVLGQSYANIEVLLVDDGSTDESLKICKDYEARDWRVKVFHQENGGQSSARNLGLDKSSGDYILFVDSDDYISPRMVEKLHGRIKKDASDLALCNANYLYEDGRTRLVWEGWKSAAIWSEKDFWDENVNLVNVATMFPWNKMYPRKIFDGLRFAEGRVQEDELILDRIIRQCSKISVIAEPLYYYRQRKSGTMGSLARKLSFGYVEACLSRFDYFIERGWNDFLMPVLYLAYKGLEGENKKIRLSGDKANRRLYAFYRSKFSEAVNRYLSSESNLPKGLVIRLEILKKSFLFYRLYCAARPPLAALYHFFSRRRFVPKKNEPVTNESILRGAGAVIGKDLVVNGCLHAARAGGRIFIGDGVVINSGTEFNPAGGEGSTWITVYSGAELRIGNRVGMSNVVIDVWQSVVIEDLVAIGACCIIRDNDAHSLDAYERLDPELNRQNTKCAPIVIKRGAFIGMRSIILKGVTIGEGSVIGAGSVVTKSVPDREIWAGNPARFVRKLND